MFSIFKKKKVIPHVRLTGVIGSAGRFNKGIDLAGQRDILKKAFSLKKIKSRLSFLQKTLLPLEVI